MVEEGAMIGVEAMEERLVRPMSQDGGRPLGNPSDLRNFGRTYGELSRGRSLALRRAYSIRLEATLASNGS